MAEQQHTEKPLTLAALDAEEELEPTPVTKPEEKEEKEKLKEGEKPTEEEEENEEVLVNEEEENQDGEENEEEEKEEDEAVTFWNDVNKLRGEDVEVDYGDVDPLSPEGVILRDKVIEEKAIASFEGLLKEKAPRGYQFLEHIMNGGKEEDFFKPIQNKDWSATSINEDDYKDDAGKNDKAAIENVRVEVLRDYYKRRGLTDEDSNELVEAAKDSGKLKEKAEAAYSTILDEDKEARDREQKAQEAAYQQQVKETTDFSNKISDVVNKGNIGNFVVPEKDREAFSNFFKQNIRYDNGKFFVVKQLEEKDLEQEMQKEFFAFKKGNLADLIERKAKTQNARRLGIRKAKEVNKTSQKQQESSKRSLTLSDL